MSEHGRRYERFAAALNKAGFNVWAHDHRGHGINSTSGHPGHFAVGGNGWRVVVDDATGRCRRRCSAYFPACR